MMTVGVAAEGLTLTVKNPEGSNVSIAGKTFNAYKIFDVTFTTKTEGSDTKLDAVSYTISSESSWFNVITTYMSATTADVNGNFVSEVKGITLQKTSEDKIYIVIINQEKFEARAFADALVKANNEKETKITADKTVEGSADSSTPPKESAVFTGLTAGYYLITSEAKASDSVSGDTTYKETVVAAASLRNLFDENKEIDMKIGAPDIEKVIQNADSAPEGETDGKGTAVNVGDTVNFKLTSNVPDTNGYETYKFIIRDTLSKGLDLVLPNNDASPFTVTIKGAGESGTDVTVELTKANSADACTGNNWFYNDTERKITISLAMLKDESGKKVASYPSGKVIEVTYSATLNNTALTTGEEDNTVNLEYSNDPYSTSTGKTTDKKTYVYDFEIVIDKYEKDDDTKKLEDAVFALYRYQSDNSTKEYYVKNNSTSAITWDTSIDNATKVTTDENGSAKFAGLDAGTYYLQETKAPTGYNPLTEDVEVVITAVYDEDGKLKTGEGSGTTVAPVTDTSEPAKTIGYQIPSKVGNSSGSALPETGGIGTTIFYVVGGVMMVVAIVLLVTKKKMSKK